MTSHVAIPCLRPVPIRIFSVTLLVSALTAGAAFGDVSFTVGAGGAYTSIQDAVNACPADGCDIQLTDPVYDLPREIWIENKANLAIEAAPAMKLAGIRPRLSTSADLFSLAGTSADPTDPQRPAGWRKWPRTGKDSVGGALDTTDPYSTNGYQWNGLVMICKSKDIRIEGLLIDGSAPKYFVDKNVWSGGKYDVFFGNVGVNLFQSSRVVLRDNEIRNFFSAVYLQGRNTGGAYASVNPGDLDTSKIRPGAAYGQVGDHLVEGNIFDRNWWVVFDESEWDLGSTFRFNRAALNYNTKWAESNSASSDASNHPGGFMYLKDVSQTIHRIHNNTIWGSPIVLGHGYYKIGVQHLFYNNIVGGFDRIPDPAVRKLTEDGRQLLSQYPTDWMDHNLFEIGDSSTTLGRTRVMSGEVTDSAVCTAISQSAPCFATFDTAISVVTQVVWPWASWTVATGGSYSAAVQGLPVRIQDKNAVESFPGGGLVGKASSLGTVAHDVTAAVDRWVERIPWKSTVPGDSGFLVPNWKDSLVIRTIEGQGRSSSGWPTGSGNASIDLGAVPSSGSQPSLWTLHSQEPVFQAGADCWGVRLRTASGGEHTDVRISKVQAWTAPFSTSTSSISMGEKPSVVAIQALTDSIFTEGAVRTFCLGAAPPAGAGLRFHVELTGTTAGGGLESTEPAYYLLSTPSAIVPDGVRRASGIPDAFHVLRLRGAVVAKGLPPGELRLSLRSMDGRVVREWSGPSQDGEVRLSTAGLPSGPSILQIGQGARTWKSMVPVF